MKKEEDDMKTKKVRELEDQRKRVSKRGMGGGGLSHVTEQHVLVAVSTLSLLLCLLPSTQIQEVLSANQDAGFMLLSLPPSGCPPPTPTLYPPLQDSQWMT